MVYTGLHFFHEYPNYEYYILYSGLSEEESDVQDMEIDRTLALTNITNTQNTSHSDFFFGDCDLDQGYEGFETLPNLQNGQVRKNSSFDCDSPALYEKIVRFLWICNVKHITLRLVKSFRPGEAYWWLSTRQRYLQCFSCGVTTVLC